MNSKLSAWKYVKNNKKTVAVLVSSLALACVAMYAVFVLLITTSESFKTIMFEMPKRISYINLGPEAYGLKRSDYEDEEGIPDREAYLEAYDKKQEELIEALRAHSGIEDAFYNQVIANHYQAVMGEFSYELPLMEAERIQGFLDHMDAKLTAGSMPKEAGEILVDETIMKNNGLKIGDWYLKDWVGETFKVSGTITSDYMVSAGIPNGGSNKGWYIVVYNDENTTDLCGILKDMGITPQDGDEVLDAAEYARTYHEDVGDTIDMVITTIFAIVMSFMAILVLVAYISFMRNRVNEYCLYASIGYGRSEIYRMILKEMLILFGLGSAVGLLLSLGCGAVLNAFIIEPKGLAGHVVYPEQISRILATYLFIMGVLQIPVLVSLKTIRTIDAIEE